MKNSALVSVSVAVLLVGALGWYVYTHPNPTAMQLPGTGGVGSGSVQFVCNDKKEIVATFGTKKVSLRLSDGRALDLSQAISASGARYANSDETFVFWNKGNTAFIEEGASQQQTYLGCMLVSNISGTQGWHTLASSTLGYSIRYPEGYTLDTSYVYDQLGPGSEIGGIKFIIPKSRAQGTNLSGADTGVSIEVMPYADTCTADRFLADAKASKFSDGGTDYSVAHRTGAAAGNIYDETVYALVGSNPCLAVRYFIHSGNIANYPPGAVREFDKAALIQEFDTIRRSLVVGW